MQTPPYTITSKIFSLSTLIIQELTKLQLQTQNKISLKLRRQNRIKTLAGTLAIEGNHMGEEKITAILEGKRVLGSKKELAEVQGAIKAYEEISNFRFDELEDLLKAHLLMMGDVLKNAGKFREVNVAVGSHIAPQAHLVEKLMKNLFEWLESSSEHPLLKSCIFHYEFEFIHPFEDGNGRLGRLWQSVILSHFHPLFLQLPIENLIYKNQKAYYKAIEDSTAMGESSPFVEFMLEIILKSMQDIQKSSQKSSQKILSLIASNPHITISSISENLGMSEAGVKKVIKALKAENKLKRIGSQKGGKWEVL